MHWRRRPWTKHRSLVCGLSWMLATEAGGITAVAAVEDYEFLESAFGKREAFWMVVKDLPSDLAVCLLLALPGALLAYLLVRSAFRYGRRNAELDALGPNWGFGWLAFLLLEGAWAVAGLRHTGSAKLVLWSIPLIGAGLTMALAYLIGAWLHLKASKRSAH